MSYLDDVASAIRARVPARALPPGELDGLFRLYAVLALAKGDTVTDQDVHDAWAAWTQERDPLHAALRPFDDLDPETQAADAPYGDAIRAAARELGLPPRGTSDPAD